jgi:hypothetical protein
MKKLSDMTRRKFVGTLMTTAAAAAWSSRFASAQEGGVTLPIISDKKFEGVEVVVESQSGPVISGPIQILGPIWEKATGAKIVIAPCHNFYDQVHDLGEAYAMGVKVMSFKEIIRETMIVPEHMRVKEHPAAG